MRYIVRDVRACVILSVHHTQTYVKAFIPSERQVQHVFITHTNCRADSSAPWHDHGSWFQPQKIPGHYVLSRVPRAAVPALFSWYLISFQRVSPIPACGNAASWFHLYCETRGISAGRKLCKTASLQLPSSGNQSVNGRYFQRNSFKDSFSAKTDWYF